MLTAEVQVRERTHSAINCIPPAEVAWNLAVADFERSGEMGIGGGGGVSSEYLNTIV